MGTYCIAVFSKTNSVEIIPTAWLFSNGEGQWQAHWPSGRIGVSQLVKLVKENAAVNSSWKSYDIRILKKFGKCFCKRAIYMRI